MQAQIVLILILHVSSFIDLSSCEKYAEAETDKNLAINISTKNIDSHIAHRLATVNKAENDATITEIASRNNDLPKSVLSRVPIMSKPSYTLNKLANGNVIPTEENKKPSIIDSTGQDSKQLVQIPSVNVSHTIGSIHYEIKNNQIVENTRENYTDLRIQPNENISNIVQNELTTEIPDASPYNIHHIIQSVSTENPNDVTNNLLPMMDKTTIIDSLTTIEVNQSISINILTEIPKEKEILRVTSTNVVSSTPNEYQPNEILVNRKKHNTSETGEKTTEFVQTTIDYEQALSSLVSKLNCSDSPYRLKKSYHFSMGNARNLFGDIVVVAIGIVVMTVLMLAMLFISMRWRDNAYS